MKQFFLLLLTSFLIFFNSCQLDSGLQQFESNQDTALDLQTKRTTHPMLNKSFNQEILNSSDLQKTALDPFEIELQWTSWISAVVFFHHPDIRLEVSNMLNTLNAPINHLPLSDLVEWPLVENEPTFNTLFWRYLNIHFRIGGRPADDVDLPGISITDEMEPIRVEVSDFIKNIVQRQCVALYFPNSLAATPPYPNEITSTAHPLTLAAYNYGYLRHYPTEFAIESRSSFVRKVDIPYVNSNDEVIVARPYRLVESETCQYLGYAEIIFEDFLSN